VAIAFGGVIRDAMLIGPAQGAAGAGPYLPVFALEAGLLLLALVAAWPLWRRGLDKSHGGTNFDGTTMTGGQDGMATTKA
jgi:hypothetical protein